jgi:hypothetical protein
LKILITGGKSSKSYKILKAFESYDIVLADYGDVPSLSAGSYQLISLGERNEETTAHHILTACLDHGITLLLPLHEFEITAVSKSMVLFSEFDIQVLLPEIVDLPKYFYDQEDASMGNSWALYLQGELVFSPNKEEYMVELGRSKGLNGIFYISQNVDELTAVLFTVD